MAIEHELPLISTIAIGLSLAFICGFVASKLRISPVIGYLFAGIIVGPHTPGYVASPEIAHELSEIGIVLLMFGVGLHFSVADLMKVKYIALTGALVRIFAITFVGVGLASLWGWSLNGAIIYGLSLSVASTVVLQRSLEQHKIQHSIEGHIAIGWLIVEDLVMILALVLVPVLAQTGGDPQNAQDITGPILFALGKVALFALVMAIAGRKLLPIILTEVNKTGSRELFTLSVLVAAIGISFGAAQLFDVSLALGAFFAGMVINSSKLNEEVAARALPFQDAFAVLFFVAIGMLFDPAILLEHPFAVIATSFIIIVVKFCLTFIIVLSFSYAVKRALSVAAGLAQIGEFSFILIGMGLMLGLLPEDGRDLILAGAFISIALNPVVFRLSGIFHGYIVENPALSKRFVMQDKHTPIAELKEDTSNKRAMLIGYGRLGEQIINNTKNPSLDLVVIDTNREKIDHLNDRGIEAIAGDATEEETLRRAQIEQVTAAVIVIPDPYETCRIIDAIKAIKPDITIMVSASNDDQAKYYEERDVDLVLLGRREIGRSMIDRLNAIQA